jgi:hypothetical protein
MKVAMMEKYSAKLMVPKMVERWVALMVQK